MMMMMIRVHLWRMALAYISMYLVPSLKSVSYLRTWDLRPHLRNAFLCSYRLVRTYLSTLTATLSTIHYLRLVSDQQHSTCGGIYLHYDWTNSSRLYSVKHCIGYTEAWQLTTRRRWRVYCISALIPKPFKICFVPYMFRDLKLSAFLLRQFELTIAGVVCRTSAVSSFFYIWIEINATPLRCLGHFKGGNMTTVKLCIVLACCVCLDDWYSPLLRQISIWKRRAERPIRPWSTVGIFPRQILGKVRYVWR